MLCRLHFAFKKNTSFNPTNKRKKIKCNISKVEMCSLFLSPIRRKWSPKVGIRQTLVHQSSPNHRDVARWMQVEYKKLIQEIPPAASPESEKDSDASESSTWHYSQAPFFFLTATLVGNFYQSSSLAQIIEVLLRITRVNGTVPYHSHHVAP